uniref:Uncharacterized protein n=1 Tax=Sciurus vulgaris TaxID=55149 RepID=A0A8D2D3Q8_SCIVU
MAVAASKWIALSYLLKHVDCIDIYVFMIILSGVGGKVRQIYNVGHPSRQLSQFLQSN